MDGEILQALRDALARMPESERKKKVVLPGVSEKSYAFEQLVDEYAKDSEVGKQFGKTLAFNTAMRLGKKHTKRKKHIKN